jgi:hypothetical protein
MKSLPQRSDQSEAPKKFRRLGPDMHDTRAYYDSGRPHIPYQDDYLFASAVLARADRLLLHRVTVRADSLS